MLTPAQAEHVESTFPECRSQMAGYLEAGAEVLIARQTECGSDVAPIAIVIASDQEFWVDCCDTIALAKARAEELGLVVSRVVADEV